MKKVLVLLLISFLPLASRAADGDDVSAGYGSTLAAARSACGSLPDKLNAVKLLAGISTGAGVVGTLGGGTGMVAGAIKLATDAEIADLPDPADRMARLKELEKLAQDNEDGELLAALPEVFELDEYFTKGKADMDQANLDARRSRSHTLGNVRTAGSFVGAAGGAGGAAVSFISLKTFDEIIEDMNECAMRVAEIGWQRMELMSVNPSDPALMEMSKIVESCRGMNPRNIAEIKDKMKTAGIASAVGAAAGVAGGVTSVVAQRGETSADPKTGLNAASTVLSGVSGAANLGGAVISGGTLSGLIKNSEAADRCAKAF